MPAYYLPFSKNRRFIGRQDELQELRQRLLVDKECQKMAVIGLGGVGKTQVALEFAQSIKSERLDYSIFWLTSDMHRLVHLATRIWLNREQRGVESKKVALEHVAATFPFGGHENVRLRREYMPHALRLMGSEEGNGIAARAELALQLGVCLNDDGRTSEAVVWLKQSCVWNERELVEDDADRLLSQYQLAVAYRANGEIGEAIKLLKHVVEVQEKLAEDHPSRLASQHVLAMAYQANGQIGEAIKLLKHVVEVQEKLAEDHPSRLASQHELAIAYRANGEIGSLSVSSH